MRGSHEARALECDCTDTERANRQLRADHPAPLLDSVMERFFPHSRPPSAIDVEAFEEGANFRPPPRRPFPFGAHRPNEEWSRRSGPIYATCSRCQRKRCRCLHISYMADRRSGQNDTSATSSGYRSPSRGIPYIELGLSSESPPFLEARMAP